MNLKEAYNQESFLEYIKEFIPGFSRDLRPAVFSGKLNTVKKAKFLGSSEDLELSVFELKVNGSAEKKISQARDGFRIMKEYQVYRALMIYFSDEDQNWRFSLMQMNPDLNEKGRVITKISNPRRYSFYLGPDAKTKTAENFLIKKGKINDFNDLSDRFNVEIVTKEFYQNYKKLFEKLLNYIKEDKAFNAFAGKHGLKLEIFSKKLLGQIVFIYFLQKKGWLGAKKRDSISKGDKRFLRTLFEKCQQEGQSFFNDCLEFLFYECLNKMPERAGSFYRKKFDCQIPFLNGGLFEPVNDYRWKEEFINIPDEIFSSKDESGILDVFDLYNFTIDENTPDDQEVSVDPEMLGKVFENLLEGNIRKGQGAFYTPREIVHYMCQESLINYLDSNFKLGRKTAEHYVKYFDPEYQGKVAVGLEEIIAKIDSSLANIKVCDPACGSGAFLVGMLNEIIRLRYFLRMMNPALPKRSIYELKRETIQNCLYGVDIDPGAVDIAKLRFWLSIVVDENIEDIEPLPNLDYKIMQGNSLLEDLVIGDSVIKFDFNGGQKIDRRTKEQKRLFDLGGTQQKLILEESETLAKKLEKYHTEYFVLTDPEKKKILKKKIDNIEDELIQSKCTEEMRDAESIIRNNPNNSRKITKGTEKVLAVRDVLNQWKMDHLRPFFPWRLHFSEVFNRENGGFDVVIANPPYIKEDINRSAFNGARSMKCYQGKMDIWYLFGEKGINLTRNDGVISFIATNNWISNDGASKFRNKIITEGKIIDFIDFGNHKVFSAGIQTMVFVVQKKPEPLMYNLSYGKLLNDNSNIEVIARFLNAPFDISENDYKKYVVKFSRSEFVNKYINFIPIRIGKILDKIKDGENIHLNYDEIFSGIDVMQDIVARKHLLRLGDGCNIGDGVFVLSDTEKENIHWNKSELQILKPYYTTKEINRYFANKLNKYWIIYAGANINNEIKNYPNIQKHLDKYQKIITSVNKPYGLHRTRNENIFNGKKILSIRKCQQPSFSLVDFPCYVSRAFLVIKTGRVNLEFLSSLLNSKLIAFWLLFKGKLQGHQCQVDKTPLLEIPVKVASRINQEKLIDIVKKINSIRKSKDYSENLAKQTEVIKFENKIDQIIYELYDLTPDEIKIVENV